MSFMVVVEVQRPCCDNSSLQAAVAWLNPCIDPSAERKDDTC
jgi:hypothetical protein